MFGVKSLLCEISDDDHIVANKFVRYRPALLSVAEDEQ
jgi:hypothetical protein